MFDGGAVRTDRARAPTVSVRRGQLPGAGGCRARSRVS